MTEESKNLTGYILINDREVFHLEKEETNIGRNPENDCVIPDLRVSRHHAKITVSNSNYLIMDLNSSGGTYVNGRPIVQKLLLPGDKIRLANEILLAFETDQDKLPENAVPYKVQKISSDTFGATGMLGGPSSAPTKPTTEEE